MIKGWERSAGTSTVLQVHSDRILIANYKPAAKSIDKLKVASQLYWYSRALSFRSGIPLNEFRCCWFDSTICYEFEPDKVRLKDVMQTAGITAEKSAVESAAISAINNQKNDRESSETL